MKSIIVERDGFRFVWTNDLKNREISVRVYGLEDELVMDWAYPIIKRGFQKNVDIWQDQAVMEANKQVEKKKA